MKSVLQSCSAASVSLEIPVTIQRKQHELQNNEMAAEEESTNYNALDLHYTLIMFFFSL